MDSQEIGTEPIVPTSPRLSLGFWRRLSARVSWGGILPGPSVCRNRRVPVRSHVVRENSEPRRESSLVAEEESWHNLGLGQSPPASVVIAAI